MCTLEKQCEIDCAVMFSIQKYNGKLLGEGNEESVSAYLYQS